MTAKRDTTRLLRMMGALGAGFAIERAATVAMLTALLLAGEPSAAWLSRALGSSYGRWTALTAAPLAWVLASATMPLWLRPWIDPKFRRPLVLRCVFGAAALFGLTNAMLMLIAGFLPAGLNVVLAIGVLVVLVRLVGKLRYEQELPPASLPPGAEAILQRAGLTLQDIRLADDPPSPAALTISHGRPMVLLSAELVGELTPRELNCVIAHELGHHVGRDILRTRVMFLTRLGAVVSAFAAIAYVGSSGAAPLPGLAAAAMVGVLVQTLTIPLNNWLSRRMELAANRWALETTRDADAYALAMRKLHALTGAPAEPSLLSQLFFDSHPSLAQTLDQAKAFTSAPEQRNV